MRSSTSLSNHRLKFDRGRKDTLLPSRNKAENLNMQPSHLDHLEPEQMQLLDLSAAFDTIDHTILFNCLQHWYGIDGVVLKWVQSYLNSRKQRIKIDGHLSDAFQLPYGFPQGPVLGPLLFTLYPTPLSSLISQFNVTQHLHADDTQIYLELASRNFDSSITELTNCLEAVQAWMENNKLKLNPDKMEFIVIGDDQIRSSLKSSFPVSLLSKSMEPAESVKNLGVVRDAENSMQRHVANLCRISYYHLRELRRVCRYLNHETAVKVANALVSSRLDYCNSLLYNSKKHILSDYREFKMPYVVWYAS